MFGKRITLFSVFGFAIRIDLSWLILAALITWSLAVAAFPKWFPGFEVSVYWAMGLAGALGMFTSVVLHELSHSLVARHYGIPMKGITLFIFGGVSEMSSEPPDAKSEFWMAIAGPISSVLLGGVFYGVAVAGKAVSAPIPFSGVFLWLGLINLILAGFNLIPGFPLDGGRVLRSALWYWKGNLRWATQVATQIGGGFGMALIVLGVVAFITGDPVGGIWWLLIGLFLRMAARQSYQQVVFREALGGEPISRYMNPNPVTVPPSISVRQLVEEYMYHQHFKMYPVVDESRLLGFVSTQQVKNLPPEQWDSYTVGDILEPARPENTVRPDEDSMTALDRMSRTGVSRLLVVDGPALRGIVSLKDLLKLLSMKMELGDGHPGGANQRTNQSGGHLRGVAGQDPKG